MYWVRSGLELAHDNRSNHQEDREAVCMVNQTLEGRPLSSVDSEMYAAVLDHNGFQVFVKRSSMSAHVS